MRIVEGKKIWDLLTSSKSLPLRGNAIDLAVGAIIGAAFGKIVASLTDDLIMPPVGFLVSKIAGGTLKGLSDKFVIIDPNAKGVYNSLAEAKAAGVPVLAYGSFINVAIQFLILAFAVFMIVKAINNLRRAPRIGRRAACTDQGRNPAHRDS